MQRTTDFDTRIQALDEIPGLVHGFGKRAPEPESRADARQRCALRLTTFGPVHFLTQIHGDRIVRAPFTQTPRADGAIVTARGFLIAVETADCLPIMLVEPLSRAAAIVHAGWRGTAARIAVRALGEVLGACGSSSRVMAALGPCIGPCCYEIGEELLSPTGPFEAPFARRHEDGRHRLDLRAVNQRQLERAGVPATRIHHVSECTCCRADSYHSYRRDGPRAGRMISYIGWAISAGT
ncbi:MAG: polyphenol oxidase family protein [Vicinamibacteria bacterium]|nr:polyphenol oxidase family protein [Vicinamibacteria bacterium]